MPRAHNIEDKGTIEQFKATVQNSLPFSLKVNKNIARLAELIKCRTNTNLSISTLRRIFQNKSEVVPSLYTLDVLSQAIGFKDWNDFLVQRHVQMNQEHVEIILTIKHEGYTDWNEILTITEHFSHSEHLNLIALAIIEVAVEKQDFEVLSKIFDLPHVFKVVQDYQTFHYFIHHLGMTLRKSAFISNLAPIYAKHQIAQQFYIERFIDEDKLNGYYGTMIEHYHRYNTTPNALVLYHTLMYQRDILNYIPDSQHINYLLDLNDTHEILPHLKIRRIAMLLIHFKHDEEQSRHFIKEISGILNFVDNELKIYIILMFSHLTFLQCDYKVLDKVFQLIKIERFFQEYISQDILYMRNLNIMKIYLSYVYLQNGKPVEARRLFNSFSKLYRSSFSIKCYEMHYGIVKRMLEDASI